MATIGRWSTRHPWRAVVVWLAFVVLAVAAMVATGTKTLQNGAVGESGRGYKMLDANNLWPPPNEIAYLHSNTLTVSDPTVWVQQSDRSLLSDKHTWRIRVR